MKNLVLLVALIIACTIGVKWLNWQDGVKAQGRPFNVYETSTACVYVSGFNNPYLVVIPKRDLAPVSMFKSCQ